MASRAGREDGYFLLTLTAGEELSKTVDAMDYVFVLDVSGSMDDDGKLALSRDSLGAFVRALKPEDRFELIAFNVAPTAAFGALRTASDASKGEAATFLGSQKARGGTFLEPALRAAYRLQQPDRVLNVVILSDGMTEQTERRELLRLAGERPPRTRLFTIGIGNDVDRQLLEQLAEDAGGLAAFVSRGDDFERQARAFQRKLQRPAMSNVEITLDGCGAYDLEPATLPALYDGLPVRLYGRYRQPGTATLLLRVTSEASRIESTLTWSSRAAARTPNRAQWRGSGGTGLRRRKNAGQERRSRGRSLGRRSRRHETPRSSCRERRTSTQRWKIEAARAAHEREAAAPRCGASASCAAAAGNPAPGREKQQEPDCAWRERSPTQRAGGTPTQRRPSRSGRAEQKSTSAVAAPRP